MNPVRAWLASVLVLATAAGAGADVHFGLVENSDAHHYYRSSGLTSFEVFCDGEITLSPDKQSVVAMAPGSSLEIRKRQLITTRMVRATPGPDGKPVLRFWRGERSGSPDEARDFLARNLPEAARVTTVGAEAEARRLLAIGPSRLIDAVGGLENESAQEIYLEELTKAKPLDAAVARRAADTAAHEISSSRRLRRLLVDLAAASAPDPGATGALAHACREISSSSQSAAAIVEIARLRGVPSAALPDYAEALREISSSSEKATAIERIGALTEDPAAVEMLAGAAETIASSSEMRRALTGIAAGRNLAPSGLARVLHAGEKIASSSEKATLLTECAPAAAGSPETRRAYVATARTIESSSETRRALAALLRPGLPAEGIAEVLEAGKGIESSAQKADLLVAASALPLGGPAFPAYLDCASKIESSAEKSRALRTLLASATLTPEQRKAIMEFAEREIASSAERESVMHAVLAK